MSRDDRDADRIVKLLEKQALDLQRLRRELREIAHLLRLIAERVGTPQKTYPATIAVQATNA